MAIINTGATTLADIANLTQDSDLQKKVLIQTIRDYSGFFDQLTLIPANDGTACKGSIVTDYLCLAPYIEQSPDRRGL